MRTKYKFILGFLCGGVFILLFQKLLDSLGWHTPIFFYCFAASFLFPNLTQVAGMTDLPDGYRPRYKLISGFVLGAAAVFFFPVWLSDGRNLPDWTTDWTITFELLLNVVQILSGFVIGLYCGVHFLHWQSDAVDDADEENSN